MQNNSIIDNPVTVNLEISRHNRSTQYWDIALHLIAHPTSLSKNVIFLIDTSGSMRYDRRLEKVKQAVNHLLDKLTPEDTFSVIGFNTKATCIVACKKANPAEVGAAKRVISNMVAEDDTNFIKAFSAVNDKRIMPANSHSSIIFLTDGEDTVTKCTADDLFNLFPKDKCPVIIPIGIKLSGNHLLNTLASLSKSGGQMIDLNTNDVSAYHDAFESAFKRIGQQSFNPLHCRMQITAEDKTNHTIVALRRTLSRVCFDGLTPTTARFLFDSPLPPSMLSFCFECDQTSLQSAYVLTQQDLDKLSAGQAITIAISLFESKNNRTYSWVLALASIALGLLLLAASIMGVAYTPMFSAWMWRPLELSVLAAISGLYLFICGMVAVSQKTILLPTKRAAMSENDDQDLSQDIADGLLTR